MTIHIPLGAVLIALSLAAGCANETTPGPVETLGLSSQQPTRPDLDIPDRQSSVSIGEATYVFRALNSENQYAKITFTLPQAAAHNFRDFDTIPYALALDRCIADYNDDGSITITYIAEGPSAGNDVLGAAMVQGITTVTDAQLAGKRVEIELDRSLSAALVNTDDEPALLMPIYETRSRP